MGTAFPAARRSLCPDALQRRASFRARLAGYGGERTLEGYPIDPDAYVAEREADTGT